MKRASRLLLTLGMIAVTISLNSRQTRADSVTLRSTQAAGFVEFSVAPPSAGVATIYQEMSPTPSLVLDYEKAPMVFSVNRLNPGQGASAGKRLTIAPAPHVELVANPE